MGYPSVTPVIPFGKPRFTYVAKTLFVALSDERSICLFFDCMKTVAS